MNANRLILAIVVAFIFVFATDFLIHAVWLAPDYKATAQLWRPEAEMGARFPWMLTAQLLAAITFVLIWALGFAGRGTLGLACAYEFLIGGGPGDDDCDLRRLALPAGTGPQVDLQRPRPIHRARGGHVPCL
jgi:hypothetical protein